MTTAQENFSVSAALSGASISTEPVNFTDAAVAKVAELMLEENNLNLVLRVSIMGGGCSGLEYVFSFDEMANEGDTVIEKTAMASNVIVKLVIDFMSLPYLQGAIIDYKEDLEGARFVIKNPNAKTTCGCGSSFDV